jgi:hypothetical protein
MVTHGLWVQLLAAQVVNDPTKAVLEQLDPPKRAAVIGAVLALVLTGLALIAAAMMGARWVRRMARHQPRKQQSTADAIADASNQRLRASLKDVLPSSNTANTVEIDAAANETKIDK